MQDLLDLSKDRVSNVRISLAEAFNKMSKKYEHLEIEQQSRKLSLAKKQQIQEIKCSVLSHLNRKLFKVVQNLKYDDCEWVSEQLQNMYVYPNDDVEM